MIDDNSGLGLTSSFDMGVSRLSRCKLAKFDMTVEQRSPLGYEQWRSRRMKEKKKRLLNVSALRPIQSCTPQVFRDIYAANFPCVFSNESQGSSHLYHVF